MDDCRKGVVVVSRDNMDETRLLIERLELEAVVQDFQPRVICIVLDLCPDFSGLIADIATMGTFGAAIVADARMKMMAEIANQKETKRRHQLRAKQIPKIKMKRARGYF